MKNLAIAGSSITIDARLEPSVALRLKLSAHEAHAVQFKHRLKEIRTAYLERLFQLIVAGVLEESAIDEMGFFDLDVATLVAEHILLKHHEADVP